jgi:hypothetical protein
MVVAKIRRPSAAPLATAAAVSTGSPTSAACTASASLTPSPRNATARPRRAATGSTKFSALARSAKIAADSTAAASAGPPSAALRRLARRSIHWRTPLTAARHATTSAADRLSMLVTSVSSACTGLSIPASCTDSPTRPAVSPAGARGTDAAPQHGLIGRGRARALPATDHQPPCDRHPRAAQAQRHRRRRPIAPP